MHAVKIGMRLVLVAGTDTGNVTSFIHSRTVRRSPATVRDYSSRERKDHQLNRKTVKKGDCSLRTGHLGAAMTAANEQGARGDGGRVTASAAMRQPRNAFGSDEWAASTATALGIESLATTPRSPSQKVECPPKTTRPIAMAWVPRI